MYGALETALSRVVRHDVLSLPGWGDAPLSKSMRDRSLVAPRSGAGIRPNSRRYLVLALALLIAVVGIIFLLQHDSLPSPSYATAVNDPVRYSGSQISWRCAITHAVPTLTAVACRAAPFVTATHTGEIVAGLAAGRAATVPGPGSRVTVTGVLGLPLVDASDPRAVRGDLWIEGATVTR
jgi:hypothetical protein